MFLNSMLDVMMNLDESFLIAGETGCGKTSVVTDKLKSSCSGDLNEVFYITINTNRLTSSSYLFNRINQHLSWQHGSFHTPKGNKRMYCFIDDIHLANVSCKIWKILFKHLLNEFMLRLITWIDSRPSNSWGNTLIQKSFMTLSARSGRRLRMSLM